MLNKIYVIIVFSLSLFLSCTNNEKIIDFSEMSEEFSRHVEPTDSLNKILKKYLSSQKYDSGSDSEYFLYVKINNTQDSMYLVFTNKTYYEQIVENISFFTKIDDVLVVFNVGFAKLFKSDNKVYGELKYHKYLSEKLEIIELYESKEDTILLK